MRATLPRLANSKNVSLLPSADLEQRLAAVELAVAELQRSRGPRDRDDHRVLVAVAGVVAGTRFSAREVVAHAQVEPALATVLDQAGVGDSPRSLGRLLRRVEGHDVDGWMLQRAGADRDGIVWRVRVLRV